MSDLIRLITNIVLNEGDVSQLRIPMTQVSELTSSNLAKLHNIMRSKGYTKKSSRESAMEHHVYTNDAGHRISYEGWHGTGNYGQVKMALGLFDSSNNPNYHPVAEHSPANLPTTSDVDGKAHVDWAKGDVSATINASHRKLWNSIFDHVNKL